MRFPRASSNLLLADLITVHRQDNQRCLLQRADKQLMLPLGKGRRRIKGHPAHPGRDRPDIQGRFGPRNRFAFCFRNGQAAVVNTVRRQRPAVIFPRLRNINFISAARAMLVQPQRLAQDSSPCPADYGCRKPRSPAASARPTKGLSGGTPPVSVRRTTFPCSLLRSRRWRADYFRPAR